ncbi:MAG: DUF1566 domain-containing protein [Eubacteriales bacterium]
MKNLKNILASTLALSLTVSLVPQTQASAFSDVIEGVDWSYPYVTEMKAGDYVSGVTTTTFEPNSPLSVAQFSTMIANAFYGNTLSQESDTGEWWEKFMNTCNSRGAYAGTGAENTQNWTTIANADITRYDMAVMIYNLMVENQVTLLSDSEITAELAQFSETIPTEYQEAVAMATYYDFLTGKGDVFDGEASFLRGEGATVLSALVNNQEISLERATDSTVSNSNSQWNSPIVTSGQTNTYDGDGNIISTNLGDAFYGQDGDYTSLDFSFTKNADGTTTDNNTNLMWETIPMGGKMSWEEAIAYCNELELGGYSDWRIPTVEELFSISDFAVGWPYLDTDYFSFDESGDSNMMAGGMGDGSPQGGSPQGGSDMGSPQGGSPQGGETSGMPEMGEFPEGELPPLGEGMRPEMGELPEGEIPPMESMPQSEGTDSQGQMDSAGGASKDDGQFWTASYNMVEGDERLGDIAFGVNHSTGHIKAYPADSTPMMGKYVRAVRGDVYGEEDYTDNGDGTITDNESGLMWMQDDLAVGVEWAEALAMAESYEFAGYSDWRLPDVKELQSIVDYGGAYPAINQDYFNSTYLDINENYYYWTSTSAYFSAMSPDYDSAWYVAFGYTSHGAGAVRFSPKYEGSSALSEGEDNILNSIRLVRG